MAKDLNTLDGWAQDWVDRIRQQIEGKRITCATILKQEDQPAHDLVYLEFVTGFSFDGTEGEEQIRLKSLPRAQAEDLVAMLKSLPEC